MLQLANGHPLGYWLLVSMAVLSWPRLWADYALPKGPWSHKCSESTDEQLDFLSITLVESKGVFFFSFHFFKSVNWWWNIFFPNQKTNALSPICEVLKLAKILSIFSSSSSANKNGRILYSSIGNFLCNSQRLCCYHHCPSYRWTCRSIYMRVIGEAVSEIDQMNAFLFRIMGQII